MECVCADEDLSPLLIIFKGENLVTSWIPWEIADKWHFSCNSKGWTSNSYGEESLKQCFNPATQGKAGEKKRLLICDGHDSHISAQFIRYVLDNDIIVLLLLPHSSHILQPFRCWHIWTFKIGNGSTTQSAICNRIRKASKGWMDREVYASMLSCHYNL